LARATLEGIVFSVRDFMGAMSSVSGHPITRMAVDGGASKNDLLMQFQADQLDTLVERPRNTEATSLGAALLAGLATGVWSTPAEALATQEIEATFRPQMDPEQRDAQYTSWKRAVERARG
ncbi:FGGY-family carbohydrate kinase, partial [Sedimentibacter sp. B4]|uniref:FGGY-family carbohydrate kinase n=1 Tax=Sedimentibacter sp. B4 TaxID=304766 RepID=UPI002100E0B9